MGIRPGAEVIGIGCGLPGSQFKGYRFSAFWQSSSIGVLLKHYKLGKQRCFFVLARDLWKALFSFSRLPWPPLMSRRLDYGIRYG